MAEETVAFVHALSLVLGWTYFICWSVSYYPQPFTNFKRRSTEGFTADFAFANVFGLSSYLIHTSALYFSPEIRAQYAQRHHGAEPTIRANDVVYALHGTILVLVAYSQFYSSIWGFKVGRWQRTSVGMKSLCGGGVGVVLMMICYVAFSTAQHKAQAGARGEGWDWLDVIYAFGYLKLVLSLAKYLPQAVSNARRKSTRGFTITAVMLDLAGSLCSLIQLFIDASSETDWSGVTGNPAKFVLGNLSLVFDIVFSVQHFLLYGAVEPVKGDSADEDRAAEEDPLLGPHSRPS